MIRKKLVGLFEVGVASLLAACGSMGGVSSSIVRPCEAAHYDALAWSPDGRHIAFQAQGLGDPSIIGVINPDGSGLRQLISSRRNLQDVQWLTDSQTLAYSDSSSIHTVTLDGIRTEIELSDRSIVNARFSPDGQSVAYSQYGFGALGEQALLGIGLASRDAQHITELTHALEIFGAWSPSGKRMAYVQVSGEQTFISVMRADGSDRHALAEGTSPLRWSPDGNWLSFISSKGANSIHIVRTDGTGEMLVTVDLGSAEYAWLPDSRHISFVSLPPYYVKVIDIDTLEVETITSVGASYKTAPAWSPDGAQVAFIGVDAASTPLDLEDIYLVNRDGSGQARLTDNPGRYQCLRLPF